MSVTRWPSNKGIVHRIQFTATGTYVVPSNQRFIKVLAIGGGSSGGVAGSTGTTIRSPGGGAGQLWIWQTVPVVPGETLTVVVGAGGAAPTAASADGLLHANSGNDTTITGSVSGLLLTAKGGVKPTIIFGIYHAGVPGGVLAAFGSIGSTIALPSGFGGWDSNGGQEQYPGIGAGGGGGDQLGLGGGTTGGNGGQTAVSAATAGAPNSGSGGGGFTASGGAAYPATAASGGSGYCEFEVIS